MLRVTKHSTLKHSKCFHAFIQSDDAQFAQAKEQFRLEREKAAGSITSWLETKVNALTTSNSQVFIYIFIYISHSVFIFFIFINLFLPSLLSFYY